MTSNSRRAAPGRRLPPSTLKVSPESVYCSTGIASSWVARDDDGEDTKIINMSVMTRDMEENTADDGFREDLLLMPNEEEKISVIVMQ